MEYEIEDTLQKRLETFQYWRGKIPPLKLAETGFVYTGLQDQVFCEFCFTTVLNWNAAPDDYNPWNAHKIDCPFITVKEYNESEICYNVLKKTLFRLHPECVTKIRNFLPEYVKRIDNFVSNLPRVKPEDLPPEQPQQTPTHPELLTSPSSPTPTLK